MKLIFPLSIALAGDPVPEPKASAPTTEQQTPVEQAAQMNEKLSEILARVEELQVAELNGAVESTPIKRVEASPETK
jgi:hypothetical protein